jgi:hypothetical protein
MVAPSLVIRLMSLLLFFLKEKNLVVTGPVNYGTIDIFSSKPIT